MQNTDDKIKMFALIEQWKSSGVSQKTFCEHKEVRYHVFHYWYKRYKAIHTDKINQPSSFIPVHINQTMACDCFAEVIFVDGRRLLLHQVMDAQYLRNLLA
jgi:hypothetical protein